VSTLTLEQLAALAVGPIDLVVRPGECVCITGPSGSGKSILLRAIADLIPHEGTVWLDDTACHQIKAHEWRRQVGLLAAESQWWHDTVGPHFADCPVNGFEKLGFPPGVSDWQLARCSTGEKQRLALIRLLCHSPPVLLLDEPTASLDRENIGRVEELIANYRVTHRAAVIWVSHDPEQIQRVADRIFRLEAGRLTEANP
jgi:ABC-type iron transport system FetAB ATPase subunit